MRAKEEAPRPVHGPQTGAAALEHPCGSSPNINICLEGGDFGVDAACRDSALYFDDVRIGLRTRAAASRVHRGIPGGEPPPRRRQSATRTEACSRTRRDGEFGGP